jgi:hypothetical protein
MIPSCTTLDKPTDELKLFYNFIGTICFCLIAMKMTLKQGVLKLGDIRQQWLQVDASLLQC